MSNRPNIRLREVANGVIDETTGRFFPYFYLYHTVLSSPISPSTTSRRFYVKSAFITARVLAADLTNQIALAGVLDGSSVRASLIAVKLNPGTDQSISFDRSHVGILLDPGAPITQTFTGGNPTSASLGMVVAEVDDLV